MIDASAALREVTLEHERHVHKVAQEYQFQMSIVADEIQARMVGALMSDNYVSIVQAKDAIDAALSLGSYQRVILEFTDKEVDRELEFFAKILPTLPVEVNYSSLDADAISSLVYFTHKSLIDYGKSVSAKLSRTLTAVAFGYRKEIAEEYFSKEIDKLRRMAPLFAFQLMLTFRAIGYSIFSSSDAELEYSYYGGLTTESSRNFCKKLDKRQQPMLMGGIERLQSSMPNPFISCGGYGCLHWWVPVGYA